MHRKASLWGAFFALWLLLPTTLAASEAVAVRWVVDGDTLQLADGRKIRLIGINAPELGRDGRPDQPLAQAAKKALQTFLGNGSARLRFGSDRHDHYGRTLAYVDNAAGASAGEYLLRQGLAVLIAIPPNLSHVSDYRHAEAEARNANRGIWAERYYQPVPAPSIESARVASTSISISPKILPLPSIVTTGITLAVTRINGRVNGCRSGDGSVSGVINYVFVLDIRRWWKS